MIQTWVMKYGPLTFTPKLRSKSSSVVPARSLFASTPAFNTRISILPYLAIVSADVSLDGEAAVRAELSHEGVCRSCVSGVVDNHGCALGEEVLSNRFTDALGGAGYQSDFASERGRHGGSCPV